ncbi:conserved hypothetical protein [Treponema primitia ZAS-2]|uniref:DUF3783 domain-containing protein n=1 Tax=Treponema primitia (strain ATCC BAA-887 / DSM 12427 / ZAS-2) TaxID=545694 RepID=F5YHQ8_TREPZ|nr:DUF3783 domain-containing protein [Treponema primitia]AEF85904.1 conserved hypothetical protein [Treponema primitia ZAS-2]
MGNKEKPAVNGDPVVLLHGFDGDALMAVVRAVKSAAGEAGIDPGSIAFTTTTPTNLEWKIKALIREVRKEHEYFQENEGKQSG